MSKIFRIGTSIITVQTPSGAEIGLKLLGEYDIVLDPRSHTQKKICEEQGKRIWRNTWLGTTIELGPIGAVAFPQQRVRAKGHSVAITKFNWRTI